MLTAREKKEPPSAKTLQNAVACCKAIRASIFGASRRTLTTHQRVLALPKRKMRKGFPFSAWPERLVKEWEALAAWKCAKFLPSAEAKYRSEICRPSTMASKKLQINQYVGYLVRELNKTDLGLVDLCDLDTFSAYLNWYLAQDADGGYKICKNKAITLALTSKYLIAKGRLPEKLPNGNTLWESFYNLGREVLAHGAEQGQMKGRKGIGDWTPDDLWELCRIAWTTPPSSITSGVSCTMAQREFLRKRTGLFFGLGYETPLRSLSWRTMKWGKHLYQNEYGRWVVHFEDLELKIAKRKRNSEVYTNITTTSTPRKLAR